MNTQEQIEFLDSLPLTDSSTIAEIREELSKRAALELTSADEWRTLYPLPFRHPFLSCDILDANGRLVCYAIGTEGAMPAIVAEMVCRILNDEIPTVFDKCGIRYEEGGLVFIGAQEILNFNRNPAPFVITDVAYERFCKWGFNKLKGEEIEN